MEGGKDFAAQERWYGRDLAPPSWRELGGNPLCRAVMRAWESAAVLRRTRGRDVRAVELEGRRFALKSTLGDEPRDWWYERLRGSVRDPGSREADALTAALGAGVRVPRPILVLAEPAPRVVPPRPGAGPRSLLVLEWIEHDAHLATRLASATEELRRRLCGELLAAVVGLHRAGFYHRDLYVPHVVLERGSDRLVLLDLGRARREPSPRRRWFAKDLAALDLSAPSEVGAQLRLRFFAGWCRATGVGKREARVLLRAVVRKSARLAAHVPQDAGTDRAGFPREQPLARGARP
ncbi:MAG: lipopolysaccharide kinase InaA family protein [Planctomycetota bacterium]